MGAVSKLRKGFNMTNPTKMSSDNGKGTGVNSSPAVKVRATGTSGWGTKQPKTDTGTNKSGGKMDKAPQSGLSTMGKRQPQMAKDTSAQGGKMTEANPKNFSGHGMKQSQKSTGTAGNEKTVKTNFPLAK